MGTYVVEVTEFNSEISFDLGGHFKAAIASMATEVPNIGSEPTIPGGAPRTSRSDAPDSAPRQKSPKSNSRSKMLCTQD